MTPQVNSPSIEVVGLYSLTADHDRFLRFIDEKVTSLEPSGFDQKPRKEQITAIFQRGGRERALRPLTKEERNAHESRLRNLMINAVMIEALVIHPDASFEVRSFVQPDPSKPDGAWNVAWNEKFLTSDGEALVNLSLRQKIPNQDQFRVVFVIHLWNPLLPLRSSYGELALPPIQPLPDRLWRLTPYDWPD